MQTLNCKGTLIDLSLPKIMGIINVTPDSFYDGGKTTTEVEILKQVEKMLSDGATFLDLGGYSSRPGAASVTEEEEMNRVLPAVEAILKHFPSALLSIDTFRSGIAKNAVEMGAAMINDISAGSLDDKMMETVAKLQVPYILMHMRGTPQTMSQLTNYEDITAELLLYFSEKLGQARKCGINDIIIDLGFGFAKTKSQNFELMSNLELFNALEVPYLVGVSRKSFIYKTLEVDVENALNASTALHAIALYKGASMLRVHDVKEAMQCVTLLQNLIGES